MPVTLLARSAAECELLESERQNSRFLPGTPFPEALKVTADVQLAFESATVVILAVPSHRLRQNIKDVRDYLADGAIVVSATKGLELPSASRMSQVLKDELPPSFHSGICALSGPNLAKEIIQGKPASTVVAGKDPAATGRAQALLMSNRFRVYTSTDLLGVELAGTLKNIVALGAGISDGLEAGDNAKAAFVTRGLAEITRLGVAAGAEPLTFAGLAGLGDVIATCSSQFSRNRYVGEQLARGRSWSEIRESMNNVVEGVNATEAALKLAKELNVEMPIAETTYRVLYEGLSPREAAAELMERPARSEW
jgi:glycerol-3-phosphate dehydrogenase (NAD(P)+)